MRGRYYVMGGYMAAGKYDEARLDRLMPGNFRGNVVEKLISEKGYRLDTADGIFYSPQGDAVCYFAEVK
ncbi:MAG: hypothetical protein IJI57_04595 [Flexilinea sp.]|nr:hypothetical protein [Flexilinea sp.]